MPRPPQPVAARRGRATPIPAKRSAFERYRMVILGLAVVALVAVGGAFAFLGATQPAYACDSILQPQPAATAAPSATPRLGQVAGDLGRSHVAVGTRVTYDYCPPASGSHYNATGAGPIATVFYDSNNKQDPEGWIHNLEHGMTVVLYRCPEGCAAASQDALRAVQGQLPASPLCGFPATASVVVVRFDDMPTPYAAIVWDRVLPLSTLDVAAISTFRQQSADRGPEPQCQKAVPGASPSAAPSAVPTAAPPASPSAAPSAVPTAIPSATPAAVPSASRAPTPTP